ncbi:fibulin-2 [Nematostella vectensis]|uniref:fibulin-2 n=1 Tax=Nematostella vectensis TaxID=45351 RepID=UPI0020772902|nr:fibulin-2 [Nematostella vectensis]XP_032234343.2 fibulin-2 [Nematostella vectensis]XP_032234345.2 fibulin-2 [Nematostella vectensis]XP_048589575.1 fibulin-2 [Nematostella vectensis]
MSTLIRMCFWMVVLVTSMDSSNGKKRLPIPKSLLVPGAKGIDVIDEAVELVDEAQIFSEDHHFTKRIAIVQSAINASSNGGGLWQVDLCVFREVTQNRRKYTNLVRLQKLVRRKLGITWSRVRHHDLRRPLYSILAARLALETTVESFPKNVKSQARIWAQNYHKCPETSGAYTPPEEANKLDENTFVKVVKNSCYSGYNKCEHFCHELPQGRTACSCRKSFTLQPDGKSCKEVKASEIKVAEEPLELNPDPRSCVVNGNQCEQSCIKVRGIVKCTCRQGFVLHNNEFSCFDMDECELSPCDHECHNTPGSYYCTCKKGYTLQTDMVTCKQDHGNCSVNDVGCLDRCPGCPCPPGMSRQNGHCVETDECSLYKGVCHHNCVNTPRGYRCACSPGYSLDENGISCSDTDECATGAHTCHHNCINVPGGYFCSCAKGFRLNYDLKTCVDIDECALYPGICKAPSHCRNTIGGHRCECPRGFISHHQEICIDDDECQRDNGGCSQRCQNFPGSYRCSCWYGFSLLPDRRTCQDVDECSRYPGLCHHHCINIPGGYKCACPPGQRQHFNGLICLPA